MIDKLNLVENDRQPQNLPNATIILVSGILSIVCVIGSLTAGLYTTDSDSLINGYTVIGPGSIICGITGLVLARKSSKMYKVSPTSYSYRSYRQLSTGRVCSIIRLVFGGFFLLSLTLLIIYLSLFKYSM